MKNYEKYGADVCAIDGSRLDVCALFYKEKHVECGYTDCTECVKRFAEWLLSEVEDEEIKEDR